MADLLARGLHKIRFLLVGAIVMVLLSSSFVTEAGLKNSSLAEVSEANDTIAGLATEIEVQGEDYSPMEILITKPDGNQVVLETVTDANGNANILVSDYHVRTAGTYSVEARHSDVKEGYGESTNFEVYAGTVSESRSDISMSRNTAQAGETVEMNVELQDHYGNPISGHVLKLASSTNNISSYSPQFATNDEGEMQFYLVGNQKEVAELMVFDTSANIILENKPKLAILNDSDNFNEQGGFSNTYSSVILAAESGSVDSYRLSGIEDSVDMGDKVSLTVTAIDEDGFTVTDYTGTVRFSSSDESADLVDDYTFEADDLGEHTFSLSFEFLTKGTQTLTATDIDQPSITEEIEFEVVDADGEEEDTGDGEFTLISPASGSYSEDSLEVQGEATYGYYAIIYVNDDEVGTTEVEFDESFAYTLQDLDDGDYEIYVEIVDLDEDDEVLEVIETSDMETVTVDTTAPELTSISSDPEDEVIAGDTFIITVLSEADLEEASVLIEEEISELEETVTSGKYIAEVIAPEAEGEYTVDVILLDSLGNEVQYRDQLSLVVVEGEKEEELEPLELEMDVEEYAFDPDEFTAEPGQEVIITFTNVDGAHTFTIEELELEEDIEEGESITFTAPEEEGEYTFYCSVDDHQDLGMEGTLTVEAAEEEVVEEDKEDKEKEKGEAVIEIVEGITTTGDEESVYLSWETPDSDNSIAYYRVYYGPSEDSLYAISDTLDSTTSWVITDLIGEELYYFAVTAIDDEGNEGELSEAEVGVPLEKEEAEPTEFIPEEPQPVITTTELPPAPPDTGPGVAGMLLFSVLGSGTFMGIRKRAQK